MKKITDKLQIWKNIFAAVTLTKDLYATHVKSSYKLTLKIKTFQLQNGKRLPTDTSQSKIHRQPTHS